MISYIEYEVRVYGDGTRHWLSNNKLHREDGPAIEWVSGYKSWWVNGQRHREDGPAIEWVSGYKSWWVNGKLHREDGPAIEYHDGTKKWFLNGKEVSKVDVMGKPLVGKHLMIDGFEYVLENPND